MHGTASNVPLSREAYDHFTTQHLILDIINILIAIYNINTCIYILSNCKDDNPYGHVKQFIFTILFNRLLENHIRKL